MKFLLLLLFIPHGYAAEVSCECQKLECDPCSVERGLTFYTDKCGPENTKIKSCARPTCIPVEMATTRCPVPPQANSGPREPVVVKSSDSSAESSVPNGTPAAGKVKVLRGSVSIVHADGKKSVVTQEAEVREGDTLESSKDGGALVNFEGGNKLHVHPDTTLAVKEYKDPQIEASRRALLTLIKGKVRNQVEQKYNGKTSYYRINTKGAVAGVRGTDFVIEHYEDKKMETTVETLQGKVILASLDDKQSHEILRGEGAHFVADLNAVPKGILSPIYKLNEEQLQELDYTSRVDVAKRQQKAKDLPICKSPSGLLDQCSWKCMNNPKGEHKCRIDLPQVTCVRQRCNGNGDWAEETRLADPAASVLCPGTGFLVRECDY